MQDILITLDKSGSLKWKLGDLGYVHGSPGSIAHAGLEALEGQECLGAPYR